MAAILDTSSPFGTYRAGWLAKAAWRAADAHRLPDWLRYKIRHFVADRFPGPYDTSAEGLAFRIYPGVNRDDWKIVAKDRLSEEAERKMLAQHFNKDAVFVDLGANIGTHTLSAAELCGRVIAVEANPDIAAKLAYNVELNKLDNVSVMSVAAGPEEGTFDLVICPSNLNLSTLSEGLAPSLKKSEWTTTSIRVIPLAAILQDAGVDQVDVLKLDVEGYEDQAILPYFRTQPRHSWPRVVMIEVDHQPEWKEDCLAEMAVIGYREIGTTGANIMLELTEVTHESDQAPAPGIKELAE